MKVFAAALHTAHAYGHWLAYPKGARCFSSLRVLLLFASLSNRHTEGTHVPTGSPHIRQASACHMMTPCDTRLSFANRTICWQLTMLLFVQQALMGMMWLFRLPNNQWIFFLHHQRCLMSVTDAFTIDVTPPLCCLYVLGLHRFFYGCRFMWTRAAWIKCIYIV